MNLLKSISGLIIVITISLLTSAFGAYIILSIARMYSLENILQFSFIQIYGMLFIINLIMTKIPDRDKNKKKDTGEILIKALNQRFLKILFYLITWGMAYLGLQIFN